MNFYIDYTCGMCLGLKGISYRISWQPAVPHTMHISAWCEWPHPSTLWLGRVKGQGRGNTRMISNTDLKHGNWNKGLFSKYNNNERGNSGVSGGCRDNHGVFSRRAWHAFCHSSIPYYRVHSTIIRSESESEREMHCNIVVNVVVYPRVMKESSHHFVGTTMEYSLGVHGMLFVTQAYTIIVYIQR